MSTTRTLDYLAAKTAQEIVLESTAKNDERSIGIAAKDLENLVTKALGVLQAQGVYALYLFLYSKSGEKKAEEKTAALLVGKLWMALSEEPAKRLGVYEEANVSLEEDPLWKRVLEHRDEVLTAVTEHITADLDTLLLVRDLYEQTLIYARYGAKAAKGE